MKKTLLVMTAIFCLHVCFAQTHQLFKIKVSNYQFSPATVNAKIGDTILWIWKSGTHTTTSLTIPQGAKAWDAQMNSSHKRFKYVVRKKGTYNYDCTIHASTMIGKIKVTAALGLDNVDLIVENNQPVLLWDVLDISKVASFSVQRSFDGNNFIEIGNVVPSVKNNYMFKDESSVTGKYIYYQVEITGKNGEKELSGIKMFTNQQDIEKLVTSINPNPISSPGHLMLQFNAGSEGTMKVQLFTQNGVLIKQTEMAAVKGLNNGHFHLGDLKPGTYYIVCTLGKATEKHTIVVQ